MENSYLKTVAYAGLLFISLAVSSFTLKKVIENKEIPTATEGFAVLELFTSQGCSSCPPADAVLANYAMQNQPNIIPLAFHVDYWNYIGWNDPFSKAQYSDRQRTYANQLNVQGNYTPQMVINGKHELVGSDKSEIDRWVRTELALKPNSHISITKASLSNNALTVAYDTDSPSNTLVHLALVKKKEFTSIKRGENSGLKQTSYNIVYDFQSIGTYAKTNNKASFSFHSDWLSSDFMVVGYLQNSSTGAILAATKAAIN